MSYQQEQVSRERNVRLELPSTYSTGSPLNYRERPQRQLPDEYFVAFDCRKSSSSVLPPSPPSRASPDACSPVSRNRRFSDSSTVSYAFDVEERLANIIDSEMKRVFEKIGLETSAVLHL
jgi:hypothetical protein